MPCLRVWLCTINVSNSFNRGISDPAPPKSIAKLEPPTLVSTWHFVSDACAFYTSIFYTTLHPSGEHCGSSNPFFLIIRGSVFVMNFQQEDQWGFIIRLVPYLTSKWSTWYHDWNWTLDTYVLYVSIQAYNDHWYPFVSYFFKSHFGGTY